MSKILITTVPFGNIDSTPIDLLKSIGADFTFNPLNRRLTENELAQMVAEYSILIAGTEPITEKVINNGRNLKLISRVGIGLDNVDLHAAKKRNIRVSYTPDAPSPAVAELTIGMIFSTLRQLHQVNLEMHNGVWYRHVGKRIQNVTVGVIGAGRIGSRVIRFLDNLGVSKILVNSLSMQSELVEAKAIQWVSKEQLFAESDIVTVHAPLTHLTKNMINQKVINSMKKGAILVNTARGGIVDEGALVEALNNGHLSAAAMDVFEHEPYSGPLQGVKSCLLSSHMGSMSVDCRIKMEIEATEEAIRFLHGEPLKSPADNGIEA
jgi:D-3-phosphoglycerate dehydrogenase